MSQDTDQTSWIDDIYTLSPTEAQSFINYLSSRLYTINCTISGRKDEGASEEEIGILYSRMGLEYVSELSVQVLPLFKTCPRN